MHKRLCACGCGDRVTPKVESQHMNALAPAALASQVLDKNRGLIRRKKRSKAKAIGFPAPFHRRLAMGNTTGIDDMDLDDNNPVSLDSFMTMREDRNDVNQSKSFKNIRQINEDFYKFCRIIWPYKC